MLRVGDADTVTSTVANLHIEGRRRSVAGPGWLFTFSCIASRLAATQNAEHARHRPQGRTGHPSMITRPACLSARPLPERGCAVGRRAWAGLRQLALCVVLIAFAALGLQAEADPGPHALHQDHAVMTGHCAGHHTTQPSDPEPDCSADLGGICCPSCLAVFLPAGPLHVTLRQVGESVRQEAPARRAGSPDRILRPPRSVVL